VVLELSSILNAEELASVQPLGAKITYRLQSAHVTQASASCLLTMKLITPERNKLQDDTIEALECLKAWFDKGLIEGKIMYTRSQLQVNSVYLYV